MGDRSMKRILMNQIGYDSADSKKAILQTDENIEVEGFYIVEELSGKEVFSGRTKKSGPVARWNKGDFYVMNFSAFAPDADKNYGKFYQIAVDTSAGTVVSSPFEIYGSVLEYSTLSSVVYYFKMQRATGEWEIKDKNIGFEGSREGTFDIHGGWFDATGDVGVHMTHSSHASYFNPQQAPFSAMVFYRMLDLLKENDNQCYNIFNRRLLDEASFGADWLMRVRTPSRTFFKIGARRKDAYDPTDKNRMIGYEYKHTSLQFGLPEMALRETVEGENYEASFRAGGGYAIAALAAASRYPYPSCEHTGMEYLNAARESYLYLEANNERYTNDGKWNLIDEFCALEAAVELYRASLEGGFANRARNLVGRVMAHYVAVTEDSGYFSVDDGDRPYFSASDEGTPVVALLNYIKIEKDAALRAKALNVAEKVMRFALDITNEVSNPFGYARMYYQDKDGVRGKKFFFPHNTEMAPWWQGDNARILSLSAAARYTAALTTDRDLAARLNEYADDQIAWVLGLNPFDSCMLEGAGRHNPDYYFQNHFDFIGAPGGICNGITSGIEDEEGIEFVTSPLNNPEIADNWRWAEQWIPHASWYLYALALKKR